MAALLLVSLAGTCARAEDIDPESGRRLVDGFVDDVTTFSADFEQVLLDSGDVVLERTSGTLEISRPGRFRWSYLQPYEQWLIADGRNIWSYDLDLAQVTVKPQAEALANTPALLLGGADNALDQFDYEGSYRETETTWVQLAPKNTDSGFVRLELGFIDDQLARMVFFDNLEQTTLVEFSNVAVNEPIDPSQFEFEVPDDVDLVGTPVTAGTTAP